MAPCSASGIEQMNGGPLPEPLVHADGRPLPALPLGDDQGLALPGEEFTRNLL